jgi:hypothetical protein
LNGRVRETGDEGAGTKSKWQNKYAEVFATSFGWSRAFPMKLKSDAHEAVSLLFKRNGVPTPMIVDGSKEQTLGNFRRKVHEADCWLKQTEPHSQWQNAAEGAIRELKRGAGRKMIQSKSPKCLWDDCLELESMGRSITVLDMFELNGQVPETIMSWETSDIWQLCKLGWYDWKKLWDKSVSFPDYPMTLGQYLEPSTHIGPAMTAKSLKDNRQIMHRSTYKSLVPDDIANPDEIRERDVFDINN